ncbi:Uncharacterised protein [Mycobacterium tuberculosis]|nr:Uncharacterised protein [Mycobacterium tuberculosis]
MVSPSTSELYSWLLTPANTPVCEPCSAAGSSPALSIASQDASSSIRCCGSIARASRGDIPKKAASKPATSPAKPPSGRYPGAASIAQPRSCGNGPMPSAPAASSRQKASGESAPPG